MGELPEIMAYLKIRSGEKNLKEENDIEIFHLKMYFF